MKQFLMEFCFPPSKVGILGWQMAFLVYSFHIYIYIKYIHIHIHIHIHIRIHGCELIAPNIFNQPEACTTAKVRKKIWPLSFSNRREDGKNAYHRFTKHKKNIGNCLGINHIGIINYQPQLVQDFRMIEK